MVEYRYNIDLLCPFYKQAGFFIEQIPIPRKIGSKSESVQNSDLKRKVNRSEIFFGPKEKKKTEKISKGSAGGWIVTEIKNLS